MRDTITQGYDRCNTNNIDLFYSIKAWVTFTTFTTYMIMEIST